MKISANGLRFIKGFEYFVPHVYDDKVPPRRVKGKLVYPEYKGGPVRGTLTIGYGHTAAAKAVVDMSIGDKLTEKEACAILDVDLDECEEAVNRLVKKPITQGQFDALVSFVFNCGTGAFKKSSILRKLNRGDYDGARAAFDLYVYSKGEKLNGLVRRRNGEQDLWDSATPTVPDKPVDHPAEVDTPKPPKTMATSTEGMVHAGNAGVGTTMAGSEATDAVSTVDKVIEAKQKAEQLGVEVNPLTMWDLVGPFVSKVAASPIFWIGIVMVAASLYGWYRRRKRLKEDLV